MRNSFLKDVRSAVIKVGTSVLTRKGRFDKAIIGRLAAQVSWFLKAGVRVSLVSSGAIGAGMTLLKMKTRPVSMEGLQGAAAVGQRYLMQCYEEAFSRHGFSTAQMLLTWADLAERKRFLNAKRTLLEIQKWGLVPVINENDTVATEEIRFGDNDTLSSLLSILVEADLLIILSDTDGLYAGGDRPTRTRIRVVDKMSSSVFSHVRERKNSFTVGGMRSKLKAIHKSVASGIPVILANGRRPGILLEILGARDVGTLFLPERGGRHAPSNWIKHFERKRGQV